MVCACADGPGERTTEEAAAPPPAAPDLIADLVTANHILFRQGVVDGFGHVSVRHDRSPGHFLLARSMAPAPVTAADIVTFDLDSRPLDADGRAVYLERFIHGDIYRVRPDVRAVVHSHSPAVVPFGVVRSVPLRPICDMSGFLGSGAPVFEIRETAGGGGERPPHPVERAGRGARAVLGR
jgi:HCOMODA/2-hydroxy-3-carboxy-muconic semialdehyde decarboxylase